MCCLPGSTASRCWPASVSSTRDVPAVNAVIFADRKHSMTDTVQAVGCALRTGGRSGKIATILIPVFLHGDENPEEILSTGHG